MKNYLLINHNDIAPNFFVNYGQNKAYLTPFVQQIHIISAQLDTWITKLKWTKTQSCDVQNTIQKSR